MERTDRWSDFLDRQVNSITTPSDGLSTAEDEVSIKEPKISFEDEILIKEPKSSFEDDRNDGDKQDEDCSEEANKSSKVETEAKPIKIDINPIWSPLRPSLHGIEEMMSSRLKGNIHLVGNKKDSESSHSHLPLIEEGSYTKMETEDDSEEEFYDVEKSDPSLEATSTEGVNMNNEANMNSHAVSSSLHFSSGEELESLVRGGLPMVLRGEVSSLSSFLQFGSYF